MVLYLSYFVQYSIEAFQINAHEDTSFHIIARIFFFKIQSLNSAHVRNVSIRRYFECLILVVPHGGRQPRPQPSRLGVNFRIPHIYILLVLPLDSTYFEVCSFKSHLHSLSITCVSLIFGLLDTVQSCTVVELALNRRHALPASSIPPMCIHNRANI